MEEDIIITHPATEKQKRDWIANVARNRAKHILISYFRMIMQASNLRFDSDNLAELEGIIDDILTASTGEPYHD